MRIESNSTIVINIERLLMIVSTVVLSYFALSDSPIGTVVNVKFQCVVIILINALLIIDLFRKRISKKALCIIFLIMLFYILRHPFFPIYSHYTQCYPLVFLVCLNVFRWPEVWIKYCLNTLRVGYWFYAIITFVCYFSSGFYFKFVLPHFQGLRTYGSLIRTYNNGFMSGFTQHYSINAMYIVVGMMIAFCFCMASNLKKYRLETLFMAAMLLLTGKRAHVLFGVAVCFLMYCIIKLPEKINGILKILGVISTGFVTFLIMIATVPALQNFMSRFDTKIDEDQAMNNRFGFWQLAISLFKKHPLIGIGWGQFKTHSLQAFDVDAYVHNVYLQLLCETGFFGALIFYVFFIVSYLITIKILYSFAKENVLNRDRMQYIMFSFCMQSFFLLYCFTGNPLYDRIMYIPYFIACGIAYYYNYNNKNRIAGFYIPDIIKWLKLKTK